MPRTARASPGGLCYHVMNRGNGRMRVFRKDGDYEAFLQVIEEVHVKRPMRVLAYCLMPNHFHLVVWPRHDGDLSRWMALVMNTHVRRYQRQYHRNGHLWQGRFKAFAIEEGEHLLTVLRYVERNGLRAGLTGRAEDWTWSSAGCWSSETRPEWLETGPVPRGRNWLRGVNEAQTKAELAALRESMARNRPYGSESWMKRTVQLLGLESSLRPRGRPKKEAAAGEKI